MFSGRRSVWLRVWCGIETVTGAADGLDQGRSIRRMDLVTKVAHVHVDDVGEGLEVVVPEGGEDLLPG
jgi:hypothetical protein